VCALEKRPGNRELPTRALTRSLMEELKTRTKGLEACDGGCQLFFYFVTLGVQFDTLSIYFA
jgi:hypothetical protein